MSDIELKPCPKCGGTSVKCFEYDEGYSVFCRSCQFEIYPRKLEKFAAEAWNALPRTTLWWTTDTPTEPGWYWNRSEAWSPEIVRLYYDADNELCYTVNGVGDNCWLVEGLASEPGCEWAGPISMPKEKR